MSSNNLPQISIAAELGTMAYTYQYTNPNFSGFSGQTPAPLTDNSLFRVASISKPFAAAAIMKLVQDGKLQLSDKAFQVLGFFDAQGNPVPLSGYDPATGQPVTVQPSPALLGVTVQSLLNMSSGLPQNVPIRTPSSPNGPSLPVLFVAGSYAALSFAGAFASPPYAGPPASVYQQLRYYVYSFSSNNMSLSAPGTYAYSDTGYAVLGAVADTIAQKTYGLSYGDYLQRYILGPMGISAVSANPSPRTPMVAIGHTLQSQAYPNEVAYYPDSQEPSTTSIFPDPNATKPPFSPSTPVPQAYGGQMYVESHFGEDGMVATPLALTTFFNNLWATYNGATTGPLTPATVQEMVNPANGAAISSTFWFGLGWPVRAQPGSANTPGAWIKDGSDPGTASRLTQNTDGSTWAFTLNEDLAGTQGAGGQDFVTSVIQDVTTALYGATSLSIAGRVYTDTNGNGTLDGQEAGLPGRTIYLDLNDNGVFDAGEPSITTDSQGNYRFTSLPRMVYWVREVVPAGWVQTTANPAPISGALNGPNVSGVNFGDFQLASVSGTVFMDSNANGVQESGESGLAGRTVFVDQNRDGVLGLAAVSAYTNDSFKSIPSASTVTSSVVARGFVNPIQKLTVTLSVNESTDANLVALLTSPWGATVLLVNHEGGSGQNFSGILLDDQAPTLVSQGSAPFSGRFRPEQPLAAFNGHDANGTWTLQLSDTGPSDSATLVTWLITVTSAEPSTQTDANGRYSLTGLSAGVFTIRQAVPSNWVATTLNPAPILVAASAASLTGVNFGNFQTGTVSGTVFNDANGSGGRDSGEPGLAGRTVFLDQNQDGVPDQSTVTLGSQPPATPIPDLGVAASGVLAGGLVGTVTKVSVTLNITHTFDQDLKISLISPSGTRVLLVSRRGGSGDNFTSTVLDDQATAPISTGTAPFTGSFRPEQPLAAFNGQRPNGTWLLEVWDVGPQDVGTIQNWSLTLTTTEPTATTDANGNYTFTGLGPGTYTGRTVLPAGWALTTMNPNPITMASSGASVTGVNFGERPTTAPLVTQPQASGSAAGVHSLSPPQAPSDTSNQAMLNPGVSKWAASGARHRGHAVSQVLVWWGNDPEGALLPTLG
jgi:CubicO group peptidase (beta-lactamase class C family)/subtilisin-like proprotein convertase family protein